MAARRFVLTLRVKLLLLLILFSSVPLIVVNIIWYRSERTQIFQSKFAELKSTTSDFANQIENAISNKEIVLIIHSQTDSILTADVPKATEELKGFLLQDQSIKELAFLDTKGREIIKVSPGKVSPPQELSDRSTSLAFKIPTFVGGETYVGPVFYDENNTPNVTISVPIVKPDKPQDLTELTTSSKGNLRQVGETRGVLVETVKLTDIWQRIRSYKIGNTGYVYLVNDSGHIIEHTDARLEKVQKNVSDVSIVSQFLRVQSGKDAGFEPTASESRNEFGKPTLADFKIVHVVPWGVIAELPISEVLYDMNKILAFIILLTTFSIAILVIASFWLAEKIISPIKKLQKESELIGAGNLSYRIPIHTGDEIEQLGKEFNTMADRMQHAFNRVEQDTSLLENERIKLSATLASIADAVIALDEKKQIVLFNKAAEALSGIPLRKALGLPLEKVLHFENNKHEPIPDIVPSGVPDSSTSAVIKNDLTLITEVKQAYVKAIVNFMPKGIITDVRYIVTLHDKTEERQLEEMKLDFVSMAAHELRTPLTAIRGYLSVFLDENGKQLNEEQRMFLDRVNVASDQLAALVENLLSASRIERNAMKLNISPTDWTALIKEIITQVQVRAKDKNIQIHFTPPSHSLPLLSVDRLRISEVLSNLLSNAVAYTPSNGIITVSVETNRHEIITHVADTGPGIPDAALPHLFTKFFRVAGKLEQGSKGTGLGLFISKTIVELHKGKIWADSAPGKGSIFSFSLPVT